jgi:SAM-dependent methyltransferase
MRYRPTPTLKLVRRLARSIERNGVRGAAVRSAKRLFHSLRNHGISGTFERAFVKAPTGPADTRTPAVDLFDLEHGTDTGIVPGPELTTNTLSGLYITFHLGVPPSALREAISRLPIAHEAFTFVDIGCGKGRALMVGSAFPFRRLVGVEISPELCGVARANIALRPEWSERISVINQDAVRFTCPDGPLLIFLYNPFMGTILRRVLSNLERQLRSAPREAYLLYGDNPRYEKVLQQFPFLRLIAESTHDLPPGGCASNEVSFTLYRADTRG